ncbi:MAG TPA: tetratricopeptide repeat protein, partial [Verrucomicrobiae bacterium]|nr:tetratricopeptide repeat protein [Verrucomicrobiae bacterium]
MKTITDSEGTPQSECARLGRSNVQTKGGIRIGRSPRPFGACCARDGRTPVKAGGQCASVLGRVFITALLLLSVFSTHAATNDVSALLQKGLFEEEANRNLDAAIQAYQTVINETDKHHQFAATAIFRLAECYRKQGKTQEANALYERILREFPDQADLVKLSEQQVGHSVAPPSPGGSDDVSNELQKQILAAQTEAESSRKQFQYLDNLKPQQRRVAVQQTYPNPVLNSLMQKLTETEQELAKLLK